MLKLGACRGCQCEGTAVDHRKAIKILHEMTLFRPGYTLPSKQEMLTQIEQIEAQFPQNESYELELALGGALNHYIFHYVRGDERKLFLERVVRHWERAYRLAAGKRLDMAGCGSKLEPELFIAAALGSLLVQEAPIRDLDKGIFYLERVYNTTKDYVPALCSYAEALYKRGAYLEAAQVATALYLRATSDPEWKDSVPPAPMGIAVKAYRAEAKRLKKEGKLKEAAEVLQGLVETGCATVNDRLLLEALS